MTKQWRVIEEASIYANNDTQISTFVLTTVLITEQARVQDIGIGGFIAELHIDKHDMSYVAMVWMTNYR